MILFLGFLVLFLFVIFLVDARYDVKFLAVIVEELHLAFYWEFEFPLVEEEVW